jgi:hypothetical protein
LAAATIAAAASTLSASAIHGGFGGGEFGRSGFARPALWHLWSVRVRTLRPLHGARAFAFCMPATAGFSGAPWRRALRGAGVRQSDDRHRCTAAAKFNRSRTAGSCATAISKAVHYRRLHHSSERSVESTPTRMRFAICLAIVDATFTIVGNNGR